MVRSGHTPQGLLIIDVADATDLPRSEERVANYSYPRREVGEGGDEIPDLTSPPTGEAGYPSISISIGSCRIFFRTAPLQRHLEVIRMV